VVNCQHWGLLTNSGCGDGPEIVLSRLRTVTPKARLMPLSDAFLEYLRTDGIMLPNETITTAGDNSGIYSDSSDDDDPNSCETLVF
jgi:hypothetical protein